MRRFRTPPTPAVGGVRRSVVVGRRGQAEFLEVDPGLQTPQDDVVDAALVPEGEQGGALRGEDREVERVLLVTLTRPRAPPPLDVPPRGG